MPGLSVSHLDEFTALRFVARDLSPEERGAAESHLAGCTRCGKLLGQMTRLDAELAGLARTGDLGDGLAAEDPFFARPAPARPPAGRTVSPDAALRASEIGSLASDALLADLAGIGPERVLPGIDLASASERYRLLYVLQQAGKDVARDPAFTASLAKAAIDVLLRAGLPEGSALEAEACVPLSTLLGQAHFLAVHAGLWTGDFGAAGIHAGRAWEEFGRTGDPVSLAEVELAESQRRSFSGDAASALPLARRAATTFEALGIEDHLARAWMCEGLSLSYLDRDGEAIELFRRAVPVFERFGIWSNYVGALSSLAASLIRLGLLDAARREYALALRRLSRSAHRSTAAFLRNGLGSILLQAGRYRPAAGSFARASALMDAVGMHADALVASLYEIEAWARAGDSARALHRLEIFRREAARRDALDPSVLAEIERALAGEHPDLSALSGLLSRAQHLVRERYPRSG